GKYSCITIGNDLAFQDSDIPAVCQEQVVNPLVCAELCSIVGERSLIRIDQLCCIKVGVLEMSVTDKVPISLRVLRKIKIAAQNRWESTGDLRYPVGNQLQGGLPRLLVKVQMDAKVKKDIICPDILEFSPIAHPILTVIPALAQDIWRL